MQEAWGFSSHKNAAVNVHERVMLRVLMSPSAPHHTLSFRIRSAHSPTEWKHCTAFTLYTGHLFISKWIQNIFFFKRWHLKILHNVICKLCDAQGSDSRSADEWVSCILQLRGSLIWACLWSHVTWQVINPHKKSVCARTHAVNSYSYITAS